MLDWVRGRFNAVAFEVEDLDAAVRDSKAMTVK